MKNNNRVEIFVNRLIDSVWSTVALVNDVTGEAIILEHSSQVELGYAHERHCRIGTLTEDDNRIVESLVVYGDYWTNEEPIQTYKITNPQHIFSYSK